MKLIKVISHNTAGVITHLENQYINHSMLFCSEICWYLTVKKLCIALEICISMDILNVNMKISFDHQVLTETILILFASDCLWPFEGFLYENESG